MGSLQRFDVGAVFQGQALLFEIVQVKSSPGREELVFVKLSVLSSSHMVSCCRDLA